MGQRKQKAVEEAVASAWETDIELGTLWEPQKWWEQRHSWKLGRKSCLAEVSREWVVPKFLPASWED